MTTDEPCPDCNYPTTDRHDCPGGKDMSTPAYDERDHEGRFAPVKVLPARPNPVNNYLGDVQQQTLRLSGLAFRIATAPTTEDMEDNIRAFEIAALELEARFCDLRDASRKAKEARA